MASSVGGSRCGGVRWADRTEPGFPRPSRPLAWPREPRDSAREGARKASTAWCGTSHVPGRHRGHLHEEPIDEFLVEARGLRRSLPIFVITDPDDVAEAVSAMRNGATAVIEIPPSYAALREEVARALQ